MSSSHDTTGSQAPENTQNLECNSKQSEQSGSAQSGSAHSGSRQAEQSTTHLPDGYKTMTSAEIRENFLRYFEDKGCKLYPSSSLVPDDPSLLLTNAGMNQFKEYYQGLKTMPEIGACSCQKCLRTNDIESIGDSTHLSFFEMLGNFSFGGYSKADAIAWAYDFITNPLHLGLPKERMYFTVFEDDDEAIELWMKQGASRDHISRLGAKDNFWAAGPTGPCGPCSEIYFDLGEEFGGADAYPGDDTDRFLEIWNLVFTQYDRQEDGSMPELPHRNIDTGMGLERISAIMQHKHSNYDGDVLRSLIGVGEKLGQLRYGNDEDTDRSLRIVADHARAVSFMIGDGILPSNEGRGYVLRRLLRRAVYHGRLLGIDSNNYEQGFLGHYLEEVRLLLGAVYPELTENYELIKDILKAEEERFSATLTQGQNNLFDELGHLQDGEALSGDVAFKLHDTYGFPIDLTQEIADESNHPVDMERFSELMEAQRIRARESANRDAWSTFNDVWTALTNKLAPTKFVGYDQVKVEDAVVLALVHEGQEVHELSAGQTGELVLDQTPFYAEMGGQVGDTGSIAAVGSGDTTTAASKLQIRVHDTTNKNGLSVHHIEVLSGCIAVGQGVSAHIDEGRRKLIRKNHTATHLLDAALKDILGSHVNQAGSLVAPDHLRFDFTHFEALSPEQLARIEGMVNAHIFAAEPMVTRSMPLAEAKAMGAIALFGEKYGDVVRVVSTTDADHPFSMELCGGTHVKNTAEIGLFKIVSESSVGAHTRRIVAVSSMGAIEYFDKQLQTLTEASRILKCRPSDVVAHIQSLQAELKTTKQELQAAQSSKQSNQLEAVLANPLLCQGYTVYIARFDGLAAKELRVMWDGIRDKSGTSSVACVIAAATPDNKVALLAAATDAAVKAGFVAGKLISTIALVVDGRGGGRPNMAQAGGSKVEAINEALAQARELCVQLQA